MNRAVNALVTKFKKLYDPIFLAKRGVVRGIDEFAESIGLGKDLTTRYGSDWAKMVGIGEKWAGEIMESSTRVNVSLPRCTVLMIVWEEHGSDPRTWSWSLNGY
jgi:prenylcysteine oxidase/farnesylcysteine lyase